MLLRVGTRASRLALAQTQWVIDGLQAVYPDIQAEIVTMETKGDRILDQPLEALGGKGLFVSEIEERLRQGRIDLCVHSMKDMPAEDSPGLRCARIWKREDARDVLISKTGLPLEALPHGAKIATGSKRRAFQLLRLRPDVEVIPIRGNIDTRLHMLEHSGLDAVVLAAAGLARLGLLNQVSEYFDAERMVPACAQGALGIQLRADDGALERLLNALWDAEADAQVAAERAFLQAAGGSCHMPIGAFCHFEGDTARIWTVLGDESGERLLRKDVTVPRSRATQAADALGHEMQHMLKLNIV